MSVFEDSLAPRTRFDLNFRLGDIPVRVHPYFWLSAVFLSLGSTEIDITRMLVWIGVLFVSILVHELGHVMMGRWFGSRGHILLTGFCGLAIGSADLPERWQRNAVSLAGPAAGFLFGGLVLGAYSFRNAEFVLYLLATISPVPVIYFPSELPPLVVQHILEAVLLINLFWGLVNLLPIWPLDGGQVCRETCEHFRGRNGMRLSVLISLVTAGGFAALGLIGKISQAPLIPYLTLLSDWFVIIFFGLLAFTSWQLLQAVRRAGPDWDEPERRQPRAPWEQDADWWKRGGKPWRD